MELKPGKDKVLLLAPRRLGDVDAAALAAKYFPGLDIELDGLELENLYQAIEGSGGERLPQDTYPLVVALEALEHSPSPAQLLAAASGALLEGGTLVVSVPFAMPLHEAGSDYWRMTPDGLEVMLRQAGYDGIEIFDTGEETDWDILPESPGLVKAWMPYPRTCFATAKKGSSADVERDSGAEARAVLELLASDFGALRSRIGELVASLEASELQARKYQDRIRYLEDDNNAKGEELDKVAQWARGMEAELLELKASCDDASAEAPAEQAPPVVAEAADPSDQQAGPRRKRGLRK